MNILEKLNITEEMTHHEQLKIIRLLGNDEFNEQISHYSKLRSEVTSLLEELEKKDIEDEKLKKEFQKKDKLLSHLRRTIIDTYGINLFGRCLFIELHSDPDNTNQDRT